MTAAIPSPSRTTSSLLLLVVCASIVACSASPSPSPPVHVAPNPAPSAVEKARHDALADGSSFKTYEAKRFEFSLPLPDSSSFQIEDQTERWFVATHQPTGSTLLVRSWREYEIMNRDSCEVQARLHRSLPDRDRGQTIEERRIDVPPEYDTMLHVRLRERKQAPRFEGTVQAFGGWAHGCFAFAFVTTDDDETIVAARLSTIVHGSLERMKFDSALVPKRTPPDLSKPLRFDSTGRVLP